jgi:Bacterial protein of unknown function (DUF916)./Protein of unknown function C-terminal (DUF3324).
MKHLKKIVLAISLLMLTVLGWKSVKANEFNFSVDPILPTNQAHPKVGYYDLLLAPGQKQIITVKLSNQTDNMVAVDVSVASATTNINGVVEYNPNSIKPDSSLKYNIKDYTKGPGKVEIPAKTVKNIQVEVTMPNSSFDGLIAGGITFKQDKSQIKASKSDSQGISIQNQYQFVVGLLMQQTDKLVPPVLDMTNVFPDQVNHRNVINANFKNSAKGFLKNMVIDANVTHKGQTDVLYKVQKDNMSMAPNSNFNFPLQLSGKRFQAGIYTYKADVYGLKDSEGKYSYGKDVHGNPQHYRYHWKFSKDFTISSSKASNLNTQDVTVQPDNSWIYWLIGIILLLILILIFFFILWKRRKEEKEEKE